MMTKKDWVEVGIRLIGVWVLVTFAYYTSVTFLSELLRLLRSSDSSDMMMMGLSSTTALGWAATALPHLLIGWLLASKPHLLLDRLWPRD